MHLLGFPFAPRIRDLGDTKLYIPKSDSMYDTLKPMIGGTINIKHVRAHWDNILRLTTSIKQGNSPLLWAGHAIIVVEGVDESFAPFIKFAHLIGEFPDENSETRGKVDIEDPFSGRTDFSRYPKTKTWLRTKSEVQNMLNHIQWEIQMQSRGKPQVVFSLPGSDSKMLHPFKVQEFDNFNEAYDFIESQPPECDLEGKNSYDYDRLIDYVDKCELEEGKTVYIGKSKSTFLRKNSSGKVEMFIMPDNCITWARKKLSLAGIFLSSSIYGSLYSIPKQYTHPQSSSKKPGVGQARVFLPSILGHGLDVTNAADYYDFTETIQRQIGKKSWKLASSEVEKLAFQQKKIKAWKREQRLPYGERSLKLSDYIPSASMEIYRGKYIIQVEVDDEVVEVDLIDKLRDIFCEYIELRRRIEEPPPPKRDYKGVPLHYVPVLWFCRKFLHFPL